MFVYFRQIGGSSKPTDTCFHFPISCSEVVYNRNTCKCSGVVWSHPISDCRTAASHVSWTQNGQCAVSGENLYRLYLLWFLVVVVVVVVVMVVVLVVVMVITTSS